MLVVLIFFLWRQAILRLSLEEVDWIGGIKHGLIECKSIRVFHKIHHFLNQIRANNPFLRAMTDKVDTMTALIPLDKLASECSAFIEFLCHVMVLEYGCFDEFRVEDTTNVFENLFSFPLVQTLVIEIMSGEFIGGNTEVGVPCLCNLHITIKSSESPTRFFLALPP